MQLSVVIPVYNEEGSIIPLIEEICTTNLAQEIIVVDDGSTDKTLLRLKEVAVTRKPLVRVLSLKENSGQSIALLAGIQAAQYDHIITMDGDGQNDPCDICNLITAAAQADVVLGRRLKRLDSFSKRLQSKVANRIRRWLLKDASSDTGCPLKLFRRHDFLRLPRFKGMHRFLPALFAMEGLRIFEVSVSHRPRRSGRSKYTIFNRGWNIILDLFGVLWLQKRHISYEVKKDI